MKDMKQPRFRTILLLLFCAVFLALWMSWTAVTQAKTQWVESKVQQAMSTSIESLAPQWPRIEIHNSLDSNVYYTPIISDPVQKMQLIRHVLEIINQDASIPPVKVTQLSMSADYQSKEDILNCQAYVTFPLMIGINHKVLVQSQVRIPRYEMLR